MLTPVADPNSCDLKRSFESSGGKSANKKRRVDPYPFFLATISSVNVPSTVNDNCILMNLESIKILWPEADENELWYEDAPPRYVQVAKKVFQVIITKFLKGNAVGLSDEQISRLNSTHGAALNVLAFNSHRIKELKDITLSLSLQYPKASSKWITLICLELRKNLLNASPNRVIDSKDSFILEAENTLLRADVQYMGYADGVSSDTTFGRISNKTALHFTPASNQPLSVIEMIMHISSPHLRYCFDLSFSKLAHQEKTEPSFIFYHEDFFDLIFQNSTFLKVVTGSFFQFTHPNGYQLEAKLKDVFTGEVKKSEISKELWRSNPETSVIYPKAYCINRSDTNFFDLQLKANKCDVILTSKSKSLTPAKKMVFELVSTKKINENQNSSNIIIEADFLKKLLKSDFYLCNQHLVYNHPILGGAVEIVMKVESAQSKSDENSPNKKWTFDETSELSFISKNANIHIVDSEVPQPTSSLKIAIKLNSVVLQPLKFDKKSLIEQIREFLKNNVVIKGKYQLYIKDVDNKKIMANIEIADLQTVNPPPPYTHGFIGHIQEDTTFEFTYDENHLQIGSDGTDAVEVDLKTKDPIKHLFELGMGGLADSFKKIIQNVVLSRSHLKKAAKERGIEPVRGLLLYGPPGTGKTTLARNIASILGCPKNRLQMVSASSIFDKWLGESEKKVRDWFEPARKAYAKDGENSPLYVVIVDEIDALLSDRSSMTDSSSRGSILNQFLAEMDGLHQLNNILFIGMTNRIDKLDPAAVRSGRFGVAIEIGVPDAAGRKQIFDIYTKNIREANLLQKDVSIEHYVHLTEGFTGADIKTFVHKACTYSLQRMYDQKADATDKEKETDAQVTANDFEWAFAEIVRELQHKPGQFFHHSH